MKSWSRSRRAAGVVVLVVVLLGGPTRAVGETLEPLRDAAYENPGLPRRFVTNLHAQLSYPLGLASREPARFLLGAAGIYALVMSDGFTYDVLARPSWTTPDRIIGPSRAVSRLGDGASAAALVAGFGIAGLVTGSDREKQTSVMLAEAVVTSSVWTGAIKLLAGRERPRDLREEASDWTGPGSLLTDDGARKMHVSFPSGHSTGAWAAATVLAHQYPQRHIVPVVAYGTAAAVSYSRMVVGAHWLSDVVVGGLIGYGCARQVIESHEPASENRGSRFHFMFDPVGSERRMGVAIDF